MKYRNFTIGKTPHGFFCEQINCWACDTAQQVERAIDRYIDGDKDPQCRAPKQSRIGGCVSLKTVGRTPAPWRVHVGQNGKLFVLGGNPKVELADVVWSETTSRHNGGNAALIAASLDLLAACEEARAVLVREGYFGGVVEQLRSAIAKAKGSQ